MAVSRRHLPPAKASSTSPRPMTRATKGEAAEPSEPPELAVSGLLGESTDTWLLSTFWPFCATFETDSSRHKCCGCSARPSTASVRSWGLHPASATRAKSREGVVETSLLRIAPATLVQHPLGSATPVPHGGGGRTHMPHVFPHHPRCVDARKYRQLAKAGSIQRQVACQSQARPSPAHAPTRQCRSTALAHITLKKASKKERKHTPLTQPVRGVGA